MGKDKIALAICFCLIVALAGFSTLLYVGAKGLESKVSDLESKTSSLETQNAELNEKVQNLTNWRDAFMDASNFTFMGTEQLHISKITWTWNSNPALRTFAITVNNTGTKDVTINQILVNWGSTGVTQPASLPYILKATKSVVLTVTYAYANGTNYDISVSTTSGYKYTNNFQGGTNSG